MTDQDTRTRILDAAEELFAADGFGATTLRKVTGAAGVNLAAVHYHFGNKEGLLDAVLGRRLGPVNAARLEQLAAIEASGREADLEAILEAFFRPAIEIRSDERGSRFVRRLLGRLYTEQGAAWQPRFFEQFRRVKERFAPALRRCLSELPDEVFAWRMHFALGAMAHTMADERRLAEISEGRCDPHDTDAMVEQLVAFVAAGLRAPVPAGAHDDEGGRS